MVYTQKSLYFDKIRASLDLICNFYKELEDLELDMENVRQGGIEECNTGLHLPDGATEAVLDYYETEKNKIKNEIVDIIMSINCAEIGGDDPSCQSMMNF